MDFENIFTVKNEHLALLTEDTAVEFFKRLLCAEAHRMGPGTCKINVPSETKIPDGGIDATVDTSPCVLESDIIASGKNGYQIRSGTGFKPWRDGDIRKELLRKGSPKIPQKEHLRESIKDCLEECGTYVLVCTGIDRLVPPNRKKAVKLIRDYLKVCGYPDAMVDIWPQNILIRFLRSFPSLSLWVNRRDSAKFQTHDSWSLDATMQGPFISGESQDELIVNLQSDLRNDENTNPALVSGPPGIGKTRLVLEATKARDLAPLVIYSPADQFLQDKFLMDELCNSESDFSAIVVIDDCNLHSRSEILNKLKYRGPNIKLITIYNNHEETAGDISPYVPQRLSNDQIHSIIQGYAMNSETAENRWVELCSGSPRVAHVVGWNAANYPQDVLNSLSTINIWERYIVSMDDSSQERTEQRRRVLRYMALFKQFGFEDPVGEEAKAVAKKIEEADPQITWMIFQEIVDNLKKRKILDGDYTLAITPKALHIKLWAEWWDIYGRTFDFDEFVQDFPCDSKLVEWFYEMFAYASESGVALTVVKDLLGPNGPFRDGEYLKTTLGSHLFFALAEALPKTALTCLKLTVGNWDKETLLQYEEGRSYVVLALEKIAMWHELFADAARLLLALGEAENDFVSNNASGVFVELYSPGPGKVAPTEASPAERFPILQEAFESGSQERRKLALKACNAALQSNYFTRIGSAEYQGLRPEPKLWMPQTNDEVRDAYNRVWQLLSEQLEHLPEDECKEAVDVLLEHARGLGQDSKLADMVIDTVATIAKQMYVSEKQVIGAINAILRYDGQDLPAETRGRWEQLMGELVGPDFHSRMQRYVGMNLTEDLQLDEDRNYVDQAQPQIEILAQQAVDAPSLLQSELLWLVTPEAQSGYKFGYELGKRDHGFCLLPTLLEAQRNAEENASVAFLGGYFRAIFEGNVAEWEEQLDVLIEDAKLNQLIPELTAQSGLTDRAGWRVLNLARSGIIGVNHFKIFAYGKEIENLSDKAFTGWILFLVNANEKSAMSIALYLYHRYYVFQKSEPSFGRDLTLRLLTHPALFDELDRYRFSTMTDYYWTEISKTFLQLYAEKSLELVEPMLSDFGHDGSISGVSSQTCSVLDQITDTEQYCGEVWEMVSKLLEDKTDFSRVMSLERWLSEGSSLGRKRSEAALTRIPEDKIWEWIDRDVENRASNFAGKLVPKTLLPEAWKASLARECLVRYGEREDVRISLITNYFTESWAGPPSLHYEAKKQKLLQIKTGEDDLNVKRWIDDFEKVLHEQIENETMHEEREAF